MNTVLTASVVSPGTVRALRVLTAPNGKEVETRLSYREAVNTLPRHGARFADELLAKIEAGISLSQNQAIYVYILAEEVLQADARTAERNAARAAVAVAETAAPVAAPAPAPAADYAAIIAFFAVARAKGAVRLRVRVNIEGIAVTLTNASENGRNAGGINVKAGNRDEDGEAAFYGVINPAGGFKPGRDCTADVLRTLAIFAENPAAACAAYGQKTGECCFCGRFLCDDGANRSVTVGYGPKCASKFDLPWG